MEITQLKRVFSFTHNGQAQELEDPNPNFTTEEVKRFYSDRYPDLLNASIVGPEIVNDKEVFSFKTVIGTKG